MRPRRPRSGPRVSETKDIKKSSRRAQAAEWKQRNETLSASAPAHEPVVVRTILERGVPENGETRSYAKSLILATRAMVGPVLKRRSRRRTPN